MAGRTRETRIVDSVECPQCRARKGKPCFFGGKPGVSQHGPAYHPERKEAWQAWKREQGILPDPAEPTPRACPQCGKICSSGRKAKDHCKATGTSES